MADLLNLSISRFAYTAMDCASIGRPNGADPTQALVAAVIETERERIRRVREKNSGAIVSGL
jgi:hypothetical protein